MKSKIQSFSFLMELIIVILFFGASATVCTSFIVAAKNKEVEATKLQNDFIEAQSIIETLQADPNNDIEKLLEVKKIDNDRYQKDNIIVEIIKDEIIHGIVSIQDDKGKVINELPFVLGGNK